jgi:hypothetical protein
MKRFSVICIQCGLNVDRTMRALLRVVGRCRMVDGRRGRPVIGAAVSRQDDLPSPTARGLGNGAQRRHKLPSRSGMGVYWRAALRSARATISAAANVENQHLQVGRYHGRRCAC